MDRLKKSILNGGRQVRRKRIQKFVVRLETFDSRGMCAGEANVESSPKLDSHVSTRLTRLTGDLGLPVFIFSQEQTCPPLAAQV